MNYDEIQTNSELRAYARLQLKGVWGQMAFAYFILFLIYLPNSIFSTLDSINKQIPGLVPSFPLISPVLTIGMLLTTGAFTLGFTGYFLKRIRGKEIALNNIFDGFNP
jgi:uncharacterized membrane protein